MSKLSEVTSQDGAVVQLLFHCPACGCCHAAWIKNAPGKPTWEWNNDENRPTFKPSLKVTTKGVVDGKDVIKLCHFFVTDGKIKYLRDCTHKYRGKTIPMEDFS